MSYVSSRLSAVRPSASMAVSKAAKALRAKDVDVIDPGLGEPKARHRATTGNRTPKGVRLEDDAAVATDLIGEGRIAGVPGTAYGLSPYVRISTATSDAVLRKALTRINDAVAPVD